KRRLFTAHADSGHSADAARMRQANPKWRVRGAATPLVRLWPASSARWGRCYGAGGERWQLRRCIYRWSAAMSQPNDLSRSLVALDQNSTIIAVIEMSQSSWLVAGMLPGIERQPRKKLEPSAE